VKKAKEKDKSKSIGYKKPAIVAVDKGRATYGCPQYSEKDCGIGYRK